MGNLLSYQVVEVCSKPLALSIQQPCKCFDVPYRVVDRVVIVRSYAKPLPALAVVEISDEAGIEVANSSAGMAERIAADGMMKAVIDPLEVVCRVITDENAAPLGHREQPLLEVGEHLYWIESLPSYH